MISRQNNIALFISISKIELRNLSRILSRTIYAGAGDKIEAFKQQSREATWSVREGRRKMKGIFSKICNEAQADVIFFVSKDFYG